MEKIIEKLFQLQLNNELFLVGACNKEDTDQECKLYSELYDMLPQENKNKFFQYVNLCGVRHTEELKIAYKNGFKTAIKMLLEALKD